MNSTVPRCSIVVPSYRSAATIARCLRSLIAQDAPFDYEVIVVDSSDDGTAELVRRDFPGVCLHHLPDRVGPETARNIGAKHAKGAILAFLDSDCIAPRDWLRRLVARL